MNSKKCIGLFLALLILVSNVGVAFTMHYCGGKVASVSVQTLTNSNVYEKGCCVKKVVTKDSCCKNKTVHFQKKSDNATLKAFSAATFIVNLISVNKAPIATLYTAYINKPIATYFCDANAPPLFKLYHHYIFYA